MRDVVVVVFVIVAGFLAIKRPWYGVLALAVLGYLNPHRYAWGFSRSLPLYLVLFLMTVFGMVLHGEEREPFRWTRETVLFLALLAWFTLTTLAGPDFPLAAHDQWLKVMKIYLGIFPTFWLINSRHRLRWLVVVIAFSFGLIGFKGGIFALGTGFHHRVWGPEDTFYGGNNEIAVALNMVLPFLLLCASETENRTAKMFCYATFFLTICSIVSSWSRGGLLTLGAVLAAILLISKRKWLAVPVLAVVIFFIVPHLPEEWFDRMHTIETYQDDASAQGRLLAWEFARNKAAAHPIFGGGFGTFQNAYVDAHSGYFKILGEHGYVALVIWVSLLFGTMIALERIRRDALTREETVWITGYARAVQISLLGFSVGGLFLNVAYWDIFYHMVALCYVMKIMLRKALSEDTYSGFRFEGRPALPEETPVSDPVFSRIPNEPV